MNVSTFRALISEAGQEALAAAMSLSPKEEQYLTYFQNLSRSFPNELARAALETAILREEGLGKLPPAGKMYFTREALEQATSWDVASYRSQRYLGCKTIIDLGCSIGGDTLHFASLAFVIGADYDLLRLMMAKANMDALDLENNVSFILADLAYPLPMRIKSPSIGIYFDPARRVETQRVRSVDDYLPPLSTIKNWISINNALGVKLSPGVNLDELREYDAEVEFVSLRGELKEAVLWFGRLKHTKRQATILPGTHSLSSDLEPEQLLRLKLPISKPLAFLYEPDPAILRAGLVYQLGLMLDAYQLDPDIAYLTADVVKSTPFARTWQIVDWMEFNLKRLRAYLRANHVGKIVVKKRGSPISPDSLIRDLRLNGEEERVIFLTHLEGKPIVIICLPES